MQIIQEWVLSFDSADDLELALETIKLPIGVVRSVKEVEESAWAKEWGAFVDIPDRHGGHGVVPQSPWRFSDATTGAHGSFSYPGEDNTAVLQEWLDFDHTAIADLADRGVLRSRIPADVDQRHVAGDRSGALDVRPPIHRQRRPDPVPGAEQAHSTSRSFLVFQPSRLGTIHVKKSVESNALMPT